MRFADPNAFHGDEYGTYNNIIFTAVKFRSLCSHLELVSGYDEGLMQTLASTPRAACYYYAVDTRWSLGNNLSE